MAALPVDTAATPFITARAALPSKAAMTAVLDSAMPRAGARLGEPRPPAHGRAVSKVLHWFTSPDSSPARNQRTRCADEPWVKDSGDTRPLDCCWRRSSPMAAAALRPA